MMIEQPRTFVKPSMEGTSSVRRSCSAVGHPKDGLFRAFERQHSEGPDNPGNPFVRMLTSHVPVSAVCQQSGETQSVNEDSLSLTKAENSAV